VGTYGRGFYVLDDVSALEQLTPAIRSQAAHLFAPRSAWRFRVVEDWIREASDDPTAGRNPPYGASINYWLGATPADSVTVSIADSTGRVIRVLSAPKVPGLNRVV